MRKPKIKLQLEKKRQSRIEGQKRERQLFHAIGGGCQGNRLKAHFENCAFIEFWTVMAWQNNPACMPINLQWIRQGMRVTEEEEEEEGDRGWKTEIGRLNWEGRMKSAVKKRHTISKDRKWGWETQNRQKERDEDRRSRRNTDKAEAGRGMGQMKDSERAELKLTQTCTGPSTMWKTLS